MASDGVSDKLPIVIRKSVRNEKRFKTNYANWGRFVSKRGELKLRFINLPYKSRKFTKDFANTLISLQWRWVILLIFLVHNTFYLLFGGMWMFDAWISGDLDPNHLKNGNFCIKHKQEFTGYLLLSIETITTTGYGYLYPTHQCTIAWFTMLLSTLCVIFLDGGFISVVFLKLCKPVRKNASSVFSRNMVVTLRNGKLYLIFRVNDPQEKHAIGTEIKMFLVTCNDGKSVDPFITPLEIDNFGLLLWPNDIVHEINRESPLWDMDAVELMRSNKLEIFVTISGTSPVTGQYSQSMTSYLSNDIYWGFRFKTCMDFSESLKKHIVITRNMFGITPHDTPLCSAEELDNFRNDLIQENEDYYF